MRQHWCLHPGLGMRLSVISDLGKRILLWLAEYCAVGPVV